MKKIQIITVIFLLSMSCFGQEKTVELDFDGIAKGLNWKKVEVLNGNLVDPTDIRVKNNVLFFTNNRADYFLHAYDLTTGELLFKCAQRGRGPGEMICTLDCNIDYDEKQVWLSDLNQKRINCYSFTSTEEGIAPLHKSFSSNDEYVQSCILVGDDRLYCHLIGSKDGVSNILMSRSGELIARVGKYPKTNKEICYLIASNIFSCRMDCSVENKTIVKVYSESKRIELLDMDGNLKQTMVDDEYPLPFFYAEGTELALYNTAIKCFGDVVAGDDSFFVLYSGQNIMEPFNTNTLLEFDYNGKCLHNYKLGKKIKSMDIDFSTNKIYGLGEDDDLEPCVYEFQL